MTLPATPTRWAIGLLLALPLLLAGPPVPAQEGSDGGSLGGSLSAPAAPARRSAAPPRRRAALPEPASPRRVERVRREPSHADVRVPRERGGGGTGSFDGAWGISFNSGCVSGSGQILVSGGRLSGQNVSGSVSPSGAVRTVGTSEGFSTAGSGHLSGSSGSGTFRRSDGCAGSWSAYRM